MACIGNDRLGLSLDVLVESRPSALCPLMALDLQDALLDAIRASIDGRVYPLMPDRRGAHLTWYRCVRLRHHSLYLVAIARGRI